MRSHTKIKFKLVRSHQPLRSHTKLAPIKSSRTIFSTNYDENTSVKCTYPVLYVNCVNRDKYCATSNNQCLLLP